MMYITCPVGFGQADVRVSTPKEMRLSRVEKVAGMPHGATTPLAGTSVPVSGVSGTAAAVRVEVSVRSNA